MTISKTSAFFSVALLGLALTACGGGSTNSDGTVSGTLSGLGSGLSVSLQNNGADTITVASNGAFVFPTKLQSLAAFSISVLTQPTGQFCTVTRATGVIPTDGNKANITTIACAANSLGVSVSGLTAGNTVTLNNGTTQIVISANGVSTFSGILAGNTTYAVSVTTQPANQVCTLANATGAITAGVQSLVTMSCI